MNYVVDEVCKCSKCGHKFHCEFKITGRWSDKEFGYHGSNIHENCKIVSVDDNTYLWCICPECGNIDKEDITLHTQYTKIINKVFFHSDINRKNDKRKK